MMDVYIYNHLNDALEDAYERGCFTSNDFDALCNVIDRADRYDKYKWHDPRKNPDDLPTEDSKKYLMYDGHSYITAYGSQRRSFLFAIAWKEIEPFEEE